MLAADQSILISKLPHPGTTDIESTLSLSSTIRCIPYRRDLCGGKNGYSRSIRLESKDHASGDDASAEQGVERRLPALLLVLLTGFDAPEPAGRGIKVGTATSATGRHGESPRGRGGGRRGLDGAGGADGRGRSYRRHRRVGKKGSFLFRERSEWKVRTSQLTSFR